MDLLDFYGTSYSLNILGKSQHKTLFSFISTLITLALIGISIWLIGKDFFYKTNPNVLDSTFIPDSSEPIYINNLNFTFAFRVEDINGMVPKEDELYAFPHFDYYIFERQENGVMPPIFTKIYSPVPCLETKAKDNPIIENLNPSKLNCFDMEQIKQDINKDLNEQRKHDLEMFGYYDEDYATVFYLNFSNCKYKNGKIDQSTCISFEEAVERSKKPQYLSVYFPEVTVSPENFNQPLNTNMKNIYYTLNPFTRVMSKMFFSIFKFEDDRGWIFEEITETKVMNLENEEKEYKFLRKEAFDTNTADMVSFELSGQCKQLKTKRIFVKIQQVAANIGGIMKLIMFIFQSGNKFYNRFMIESRLVDEFCLKTTTSENKSFSLQEMKEQSNKNKIKISFREYLAIAFNCGKHLKAKKVAIQEIADKLDIRTIVKLSMLLDQEKQEPLRPIERITIAKSKEESAIR